MEPERAPPLSVSSTSMNVSTMSATEDELSRRELEASTLAQYGQWNAASTNAPDSYVQPHFHTTHPHPLIPHTHTLPHPSTPSHTPPHSSTLLHTPPHSSTTNPHTDRIFGTFGTFVVHFFFVGDVTFTVGVRVLTRAQETTGRCQTPTQLW